MGEEEKMYNGTGAAAENPLSGPDQELRRRRTAISVGYRTDRLRSTIAVRSMQIFD
jgi:hypothetical protein